VPFVDPELPSRQEHGSLPIELNEIPMERHMTINTIENFRQISSSRSHFAKLIIFAVFTESERLGSTIKGLLPILLIEII